jgi:hypothetical protein
MATDDTGAVPREAVDDERRSLTSPGGLPGFSLPDRVLALEMSLNAWERRQRDKDIATESRLREGAESFSELRRAVAPKPLSLVKILPVLIVAMLSLLGFVWAAARYPDRREFDTKINSVQTDVAAMRLELAQTTIKLDMLLKGAKP